MRTDGRESDNVEDRRGEGGGGGGGFGIPGGGRTVGVGTILVALAASYFLGVDPSVVLSVLSGGEPAPQVQTRPASAPAAKPQDEMGRFVSVVLADTEDTWTALFKQAGRQYQTPKLVLFSGSTPTACGVGQTAAGPFYCPLDQKVYIDLEFYRLLQERFKAPGQFAQAYVIAHEIGHHVQNQLGIMAETDRLRRRMTETQYNQVSVRLELQADCFAGVWANNANRSRQILESGDVESALRAAAAIGDDTLQRRSQGMVVPESFTHGSSEQRVRWFKTGVESGSIEACDTFRARSV